MSANPKSNFTPGQPATYTPHAGKSKTAQAGSSPATQSESPDRRPSAPERPDVPDRSNPPRPSGETVEDGDAGEKTRDMTAAEANAFGSGDQDARDAAVTGSDHPGETRRSKPSSQ